MTWRRLPYRCTTVIDSEGHKLHGEQCDGLAVWLDPDDEPRCTMHGPPTKVEKE